MPFLGTYESRLTVRPNPANSAVWVSASAPLSEVLIFNFLGEKVK